MEKITLECVRILVESMQAEFGEEAIPMSLLRDDGELDDLREALDRVGVTDPLFDMAQRRAAEDAVFDHIG